MSESERARESSHTHSQDDVIDVIEGNRVYIPCLHVFNKIDKVALAPPPLPRVTLTEDSGDSGAFNQIMREVFHISHPSSIGKYCCCTAGDSGACTSSAGSVGCLISAHLLIRYCLISAHLLVLRL